MTQHELTIHILFLFMSSLFDVTVSEMLITQARTKKYVKGRILQSTAYREDLDISRF